MKITIFASIGAQNLGDELILKNEIEILRKNYKSKKIRFIVFSYDYKNPFYKEKDIEYKEYFPIGLKNPKNILKNLKNFFTFIQEVITSNLIVIGGGGLFFDTEMGNKKNPLNLWLFRVKFFHLFLKKIYFFRVGININKNESLKKISKIFHGKKNLIEVRDNYSLTLLKNLGIENVVKKYDPVFLDNGKKIEEILLKKISIKKIYNNFNLKDLYGIDFKNKKIGIAFRSGYFSKEPELEILMIQEIIKYIQNFGGEVIFLPHSFSKQDITSNDYKWMQLIITNIKNVYITNDIFETYNFYKYKKINIVLAQRLHSIILSQVYEIPFIGISYTKKTDEVLKFLK